ncbi:MAG: HigA family addiction module antitoxin [Cyanobacteriota bacterium]|nr:HigA family addiction module antitoxin [Cyanobacteriota bacterium]
MKNLHNVTHERQVRPAYPGEVIADILEDIEITQTQFAEVIGVSQHTVEKIVQGREPITADLAIRIGKTLGNGHQLWLNLQQKVDIWDAIQVNREEYGKVTTIVVV